MSIGRRLAVVAMAGAAAAVLGACGGDDDALLIYSGRSESLVDIIERFEEETGIDVEVKYGGSAALAGTILEEGDNTPADVFFAQDSGSLGLLSEEGVLTKLPASILELVPAELRSPVDEWVGVSGRSRVVAYNTDSIDPAELPASILDFTDPEWKGRIGWAPTNGSFQSFVTGLRQLEGDGAARAWLEGIEENDPVDYPNNVTALQGAANGEVDVAFVNHYYLYRFLAEEGDGFGARNFHQIGGDAGALINVAGAGIVAESEQREDAEAFIAFLLSEEAQRYFADETYEYPLVSGVETNDDLIPIDELEPPAIDLGQLSDLRATIDMLEDVGVLP